jgi:hypothetical protein
MLVCGAVGMTFHHAPIALGTCTIAISTVKKGLIKLSFQTSTHAKMEGMGNAIILSHDKDIIVCK